MLYVDRLSGDLLSYNLEKPNEERIIKKTKTKITKKNKKKQKTKNKKKEKKKKKLLIIDTLTITTTNRFQLFLTVYD